MTQASDASPVTVQDHLGAARQALRQGHLGAAHVALRNARALDPEGRVVGVFLAEADVLRAEGRLPEAQAVLHKVRDLQPGNFWAAYGLADLAYRQGDSPAARIHLDAARALDKDGKVVALSLLEADFLRDAGRLAEAEVILTEMLARHPDDIWGYQRLAQLAKARNDPGAARAHLEAALARDDSHLALQLELAHLEVADGGLKAAMMRLEKLYKRHGAQLRILLPLSRICRRAGQRDREDQILQEAIALDPLDPALLRHLFASRATEASPEALKRVLEVVRTRGGGAAAQVDDLHLQALLQTRAYAEALQQMRRQKQASRTAPGAQSLATALFGAHHYKLGLRYVRFCLRRWPGHAGLLDAYVSRGLRQGEEAAVLAAVEAAGRTLSDHAMQGHWLLIAGFRGDLEGAVAAYARLRALGQVTPPQRDILAKLIFTLLDPAESETLAGQIGHPMAETGKPLHRSGLPGLMTLEFDLECQALAETGYFDDPADWVRARGHSTVPAIRLVDAWRAAAPAAPPDTSPAVSVPQKIYQYWNEATPPPALEPMIASWAGLPGYEHRLIDRAGALTFLRENAAPEAVRAFLLAQNPAQEADFLRLTLLARKGGIWADADDYLYGDLGQVLGADPRGLILYREPLGGAVGNNFMATPAGHPVVVYAARLAQQSLLQRANETAWNKTGPGLLTRALAQFLAQTNPEAARSRVTILDWPRIARQIATNNPVHYKTQAGYWDKEGTRMPGDAVWQSLMTALEDVAPHV